MGKIDPMDKLWKLADVNRRELIASGAITGVISGFAAAVQPVMAQTAIVTEPKGLDAGVVEIPVGREKVTAYRAMPAGGKNLPLILVVQEIFGVHEHIKDVCRRFALLGYCAIAPELYQRQGDVGKLADMDAIRKVVGTVPDKQVFGDLDATVAWATSTGVADSNKLGITGFCWGGRIVWLYTAHNSKVKAGVAWYGRLVGDKTANTPEFPVDIATKLGAPVLGLYGGADAGIPVDTVEQMRTAIGAGSKSSIQVFPDTPHAFFADYRPSYRKAAADDGWSRCTAWFKANGVA